MAYICTFVVLIVACIGLAEVRTYGALLGLRCLQSAGSASTIAVGSGVVGDITTRQERGGYMGFFQAGLLAPVAVAPIIGGALAGSSLGWRSIFWFLTIYGGAFLVILILVLPETLRSLVGNGSREYQTGKAKKSVLSSVTGFLTEYPLSWYRRTTKVQWDPAFVTPEPATRKRIDFLGPFRIMASKRAAPIIFFVATYYAVWQMSVTAISPLFSSLYGLSVTEVGLTFLGNGLGSIVGTLVTGKILDADYRRVLEAHNASRAAGLPDDEHGVNTTTSTCDDDFPLEKARLRLIPIFSLLQCGSIALFGWTTNFPDKVPIAIPIISTFVSGWTAVSTVSLVTTYLVDVFSEGGNAAAAGASLNLARCLFGAGGTSFIMPMISAIGVGWAFTVCIGAQVVALVGAWVQWKFAGKWRKEHSEMERRKKEEQSS